jgi:ribosomal-protein-alanine N-acetyltransferase
MRALRAGRLVLEPQVAAHAAEMFALLGDPAIYEFEGAPPETVDWLQRRFAQLESRRSPDGEARWLNWVIRLPSRELAGYVQATVGSRDVAEIAFVLASRHWRRGIGKAAVSAIIEELAATYGVRHFAATLKAGNHRSLALLTSLGFDHRPPPAGELPCAEDELVRYKSIPRANSGAQTVRLEAPSLRRAGEFLDAVRASRRLHRGWVAPPRDRATFRRFVEGAESGSRASFLVITDEDAIAGVVNASEIVRGNFKSAYLGYYAFEPHAGRGLMRVALRLVIAECFAKLRLHRLEANIQPANTRSIALARSLGFRYEGLSPRYLKVCGRWRDHERWALLADERRKANR